jgi:hypothetical protein
VKEPFNASVAKAKATQLFEEGSVVICDHAREQMVSRGLNDQDCMNVVRAGQMDRVEPHGAKWRYRFSTPKMAFIVEFGPNHDDLTVVTGWRK